MSLYNSLNTNMSRKKLTKYEKNTPARIVQIRRNKALSQSDFATLLGFSKSYLSEVENGKTKPSLELLFSISENTNANLHWLLTGEGDPFIERDPQGQNLEKKDRPLIYNEGDGNTGDDHEAAWDKMGFSTAVDMLHRIYASGNKKLIRAINANLDSFSEAVTMEKKVADLQQRLERLEKIIADLESREGCCKESTPPAKKTSATRYTVAE